MLYDAHRVVLGGHRGRPPGALPWRRLPASLRRAGRKGLTEAAEALPTSVSPRPLSLEEHLHEPVSPELAMVDPELRRRLLDLEHERIIRVEHQGPGAISGVTRTAVLAPTAQPKRLRSWLVAVSVAIGCLAAFTVVTDAHIRPFESSASNRSTGNAAPTATRFSWPAERDAEGYRIAVYHGEKLVFNATTSKPYVMIPEGTGSSRALPPGTYKWYVWPIRHGARVPVAIVSSQLVVPTV